MTCTYVCLYCMYCVCTACTIMLSVARINAQTLHTVMCMCRNFSVKLHTSRNCEHPEIQYMGWYAVVMGSICWSPSCSQLYPFQLAVMEYRVIHLHGVDFLHSNYRMNPMGKLYAYTHIHLYVCTVYTCTYVQYAYTHTSICTVYTCTYVHTHTHIHLYVLCIHVHMYNTHTHIHLYVLCIHVRMYNTHTHIHLRICTVYTCTYVHTHTHIHLYVLYIHVRMYNTYIAYCMCTYVRASGLSYDTRRHVLVCSVNIRTTRT